MCYYLFFAIVYFVVPPRSTPRVEPRNRFLIVIPAHNEEQLISTALDHVSAVDYPHDLFQMAVIADNCNDHTAVRAAEQNALVLERHDSKRRGKGFALSWALPQLPMAECDAVIIIDADSIMDRHYLQEMNAALCGGARMIQGYNNLSNPDDTHLTRLMHVTSVLKNLLFNEGKTRLGLSVALMGTGMCFDRGLLEEIGWGAHSIGEDWEYSTQLIQRGIAINFHARAITYSREATSLQQGFSQRLRWAGGKFDVIMRHGLPTLWQGLRFLDFKRIDAVMNLLVPTFSQVAYLNVFAVGIVFFLYPPGNWGNILRIIALLLLVLQMAYFVLGLIVMKASARTALSVIASPLFLCWKVVVDILALSGYKRKVWQRTRRDLQDTKPKY